MKLQFDLVHHSDGQRVTSARELKAGVKTDDVVAQVVRDALDENGKPTFSVLRVEVIDD